MKNNIKQAVDDFLSGNQPLSRYSELYKVHIDLLISEIRSRGYIFKKGYSSKLVSSLKNAVNEYISNYNNNPSLTKLSKKYNIGRKVLTDAIVSLGYTIVNHLNKIKFNEHIFDSIDTEEKAYWLGFIFADGYVNDKNGFELSLSIEDIDHLKNFNKCIERTLDVRNDSYRCRLSIKNEHFVNTLKKYGCVPRKSLVLVFPDKTIFKDKSLIRHFIRGYWDGDGCLTYCDKSHLRPKLEVLGTEDFLTGVKNNLPLKFDYKLHGKTTKNTKVLSISGINGFELAKYLYNNSVIYLDRKYEKYLEYCRLYEESYRESEGKNGEP